MTTAIDDGDKRSSVAEKSLHFAEDSKFFCRLLSKARLDGPSLRFYEYGITAVAVPFRWELQPGTPKHYAAADTLPPLTPPPSSLKGGDAARFRKKHSFPARSRILVSTVLVKLRIKKAKLYHSSSSSSALHPMLRRRLPSSWSSSLASCGGSDDDSDGHAPRRRACGCFGVVRS